MSLKKESYAGYKSTSTGYAFSSRLMVYIPLFQHPKAHIIVSSMDALTTVDMDVIFDIARSHLFKSSMSPMNTSTSASSTSRVSSTTSTTAASTSSTASNIDLFYSPTTKSLGPDPTSEARDFAHLAVVCVVVPLAIVILAAVTTAWLLVRRSRRKREVQEIERRKTMAREHIELRDLRPAEEFDKDLGHKRDGVLAKKMYLIEMPRAA